MKCKKFDNWIKSIPVNPRGYTKKSDDFPYLSVFVYANGKKRVFLSRSQGQKVCDIGYFEADNGGFETLWETFKLSDDYRMNRAEIKEFILNYSHPIKEEYEVLQKKEIASVKKAIPPQEDSNKKMTYSQIDSWIADLPMDRRYYTKIIPDFPYVQVNVKSASRVKELWFINPKTKRKLAFLGIFGKDKSEQLFSHIFTFFDQMKSSDDQYKMSYQWIIDIYSMPKVDKPKTEEEKEKLEEKIAELKQKIELEEPKKTKDVEKDDCTYIDYNSFIWAKNRYTREKAEESKVSYTIAIVAIYIIAATIISTLFFSSEYYSKTSSIMAILWIFAFIAASIWLGKKADKKLDEIFKRLREEYNNSFSLEDEAIYNQVFKNMVDREVEYLTRSSDKILIYLIQNHSSDIPEEVYELKDKSKLNASGFVSAISLDNKKALLEKYLDKQANFAREKSITLLNRIKEEGDEVFTKDIVTPSGQIDPLITDIIKKHNISVSNSAIK